MPIYRVEEGMHRDIHVNLDIIPFSELNDSSTMMVIYLPGAIIATNNSEDKMQSLYNTYTWYRQIIS